jgi:hypothetical protein
MIEANGDPALLDYLTGISNLRLWGTKLDANGRPDDLPACSSSKCYSGIFNYIGKYIQSGWLRYGSYRSGDYSGGRADPPMKAYQDAGISRQSVAARLATRNRVEYGNNTPYHWGVYKPGEGSDPALWWIPEMLAYFNNHDYDWFGNERWQIVYMNGNPTDGLAIVYTVNQAAFWGALEEE